MSGLESFFLTALHNAWLTKDRALFRAAVRAWSQLPQASPSEARQARNGRSSTPIIFYDRENNMATIMTDAFWSRISDSILHLALGGGDVGGAIRGSGSTLASDGLLDFISCVGAFTTTAGGGGAVVGGVIGGPPGAGTGAGVGGAFGFAFGLGYCGVKSIFGDGTPKDSDKGGSTNPKGGSSGPVSSNEPGTSGNEDTGNEDDTEDGTDDDTDEESEDETEVDLVYPVPDDLISSKANYAELISTPSPDSDDSHPIAPPGTPGPNPVLRGIATFALHDMPRLGNNGTIVRLGFMRGALGFA
jgi:hypothetical protein